MSLQYRSIYKVEKFGGLLTEFKDIREVPDGYSPDELNWITQIDQQGIELRRGTKLLGTTRREGVSGISGLGVGLRYDGTEVPFFSYDRKINYYDSDADDTVEVDTVDVLPAAASGETLSIESYQNIAGANVFASSPNSSIYKIPVANPGSVVDQLSTTYRGFMKFGQSRAFLFNRHGETDGNIDQTGLYVSKVDKVGLSQYPAQTTGESVGASGSTSYTHTLTNITGVRTAMFVSVTDGNETFVDNRNGVLVGDKGGTGTVNYATGEIAVTFNSTTTGAVTCSYYYEDSTNGGVCDFSIADVTNRQPGEGNYFAQYDGGGKLRSVFPLATVFYCFHELKTWQVSIPVDDESGTTSISTNLPFRERMGVKSIFGAYGGEQGSYFINTADESKPEFLQLALYSGATTSNISYPKLLSEIVDLSGYAYDYAVVREWGDYVVLCCQQYSSGVAEGYNTRMFLYNKKTKTWDLCDNPSSVLAIYNGELISGDPLTNNVFVLFSGWDDDQNLIPNYWTSGSSDLGIDGQKRFTRFVTEGLIQKSQSFAIDFAFDGGDWVEYYTVSGTGNYVDKTTSVSVGPNTMGSKNVGGANIEYASRYRVEFRVQSSRFNYVRVRFRALSGGYVSINEYSFKDIRQKSLKSLPERMG